VAEYPPPPVPDRPSLGKLQSSIHACRACDLFAPATQPVMGEGARGAPLMLVGEQPGDREDIEGHPFVGPAGRILDQGLQRAGISPRDTYITNVVKHFRYKAGGKRRIHQKPDRWQINACLPWLHAELAVVRPSALVCLGATAAQALLGSQVRIGKDRGRPMDSDLAELVTITTHPSAILRAHDAERKAAMEQFADDLSNVATWLQEHRGARHPDGRRAETPAP
jgi:uracil-DNA glycosylase family protein